MNTARLQLGRLHRPVEVTGVSPPWVVLTADGEPVCRLHFTGAPYGWTAAWPPIWDESWVLYGREPEPGKGRHVAPLDVTQVLADREKQQAVAPHLGRLELAAFSAKLVEMLHQRAAEEGLPSDQVLRRDLEPIRKVRQRGR